jgi:peptidoglycan/LPS O-acetylase OafA/YrhL
MHRPLVYRPEIDGLRAFAVLSVLIYHLNPGWLPGGYLGVDVFFVISGFLITSIIVKDCAAGEFSFKQFYLRRARRILPALLTVMALTGAAAYFVLFPDEMRAAAKACQKALLCWSNYHFAKEGGYFDPSAEANPFLHTWSLGVEEQFYFVFPLLAVFAHRRGWLKARWLGGLVLFGLAASCLLTFRYPDRAFFTLESRAWELGAGSWLAVAVSRGTLPGWFAGRAVSVVAIGLLLSSVILLESGPLTPAPMAAVAVLGAVLMIGGRAGGTGSREHRVIASAPLRFFGKISYSLYLVHWPLIVFVRAWHGEMTPAITVGVGGISIVLAVVLHHAVEQPMRHFRKTPVFLAGLAATSAVMLWGADYFHETGKGNPAMKVALGEILPEWQKTRNKRPSPYLIGKTDAEPSMGLWGDSHAMALIGALEPELKLQGICCEVWAHPGNLPVLGVKVQGKDLNINDNALAALSRPAIRQVIIAARWTSYLKGKAEDHKNAPRIVGAETPAEALALMRTGMKKALERLQRPGRTIVLVFPVPESGIHVPYFMARRSLTGQGISDLVLAQPAKDYADRHDLAISMLDEICRQYSLLAVYPDKLLIHDGALQISRGKQALYYDDDHLSHLGSIPLVKEILNRFTRPTPIGKF